ncbi:unnamed protein product [Cylicocyclus nassatus]|uniref:Peptidase C1A papain C-terminal domain-containing protein n=1 Tax=Cylicocyclus nassatus TaxID=53992 RepID=A0AA36M1X9_CYLNA|nr:unnamed protein product [Cylicocyclus nassatus]
MWHTCKPKYYGPYKSDTWKTPTCRSRCQFRYRKNYNEDKFWGRNSYYVLGNETDIRREIYDNGSVIATFQVYSDFSYYTKGVYIQKSGSKRGAHAVKIVGWGVDKTSGTIPYWLVANSWNTDWGENGFFRIIRGTDECGIESNIVGGHLIIYNAH